MYIINCCIFFTAVLLSPYSVHYQTLCAYYLVVTLNLKCRITFRVQRQLWVSFINWAMHNCNIKHFHKQIRTACPRTACNNCPKVYAYV